jgi:uncharacterized SAM-dependent methyltransferase
MGAYLYGEPLAANDPVQGSALYEAVLDHNKEYYISAEESEIIREHASEIARCLKGSRVLMDLGPGCGKAVQTKTLPILERLENLQSYAPVDMNIDYLARACLTVKRARPSLNILPSYADFIDAAEAMKLFAPASVLFTGSALANLAPAAGERLLQKIRGLVGGGGRLVVGQDINRDAASLSRAYEHPLGKALIENVFYRIRRDLNLKNFDPGAFAYRPEWRPEDHVYRHGCVSLKDQSFQARGQTVSVSKGQEFEVTHSRKYESNFFLALMERQGFRLERDFLHPEGRMGLYIFEASPSPPQI